MPVLFANSPAHVETREIASRQRSHGITEFEKRLIDCFDRRSFFYQKLRFAPLWSEHPVAYEAAAVPSQRADLAQLFEDLHAGCDYFPARFFAAHHFEK